jgi:MoxR-like ATPase
VFVPTRAYRRALTVLDVHRFAVLTGPPAMGKTAIARIIAFAHSPTARRLALTQQPSSR